MHKLLPLVEVSAREGSHREHVKGKALVLEVFLAPSDIERCGRESNRSLDVPLSEPAIANARYEVTDALFFVGRPKEFDASIGASSKTMFAGARIGRLRATGNTMRSFL